MTRGLKSFPGVSRPCAVLSITSRIALDFVEVVDPDDDAHDAAREDDTPCFRVDLVRSEEEVWQLYGFRDPAQLLDILVGDAETHWEGAVEVFQIGSIYVITEL